MSDVVFILGAGASAHAQVPLMSGFLESARDLMKNNKVKDAATDFRRVFDAIGELQLVCAKADVDLKNVEQVFAAFEMAKLLNRFGSYDEEHINALSHSMRVVIARTVENRLRFAKGSGNPMPPHPYREFVQLVEYLQTEGRPRQSVSVITFNYDLALDYAFHFDELPVTYALGEEADSQSIPLLKLHGSVNWARCPTCDTVVAWSMDAFLRRNQGKWKPKAPNLEETFLKVSPRLAAFRHQGHTVETIPMVVPPTWNKPEYYKYLKPVWVRAGKELSEAENVFVIGYSLPTSDAFFKYLYMMGAVGKTTLDHFWVFDPNPEVGSRFHDLLGSNGQKAFSYQQMRFSEAMLPIKALFR